MGGPGGSPGAPAPAPVGPSPPPGAPPDAVRAAGVLRWRDPRAIERAIRIEGPFVRRFFRPEVRGLDALGRGPYLLVANHSIAAPWEIFVLLAAWVRAFGAARPIYGLAHRFGFRLPGLRGMLRAIGGIPATHEAARETLASGASLIVFPGGNLEAARPFRDRDRSDLGGHAGFARIALATGVPVVPVSIVGSHAVNPVFHCSEALAHVSLARSLFRVRALPISLAQILIGAATLGLGTLLLPWWAAAWAAFLAFSSPLAVFFPLLPSRIVAQVGAPLDPRAAAPPGVEGEAAVAALYAAVQARIQEGMDALVRERRGVLG